MKPIAWLTIGVLIAIVAGCGGGNSSHGGGAAPGDATTPGGPDVTASGDSGVISVTVKRPGAAAESRELPTSVDVNTQYLRIRVKDANSGAKQFADLRLSECSAACTATFQVTDGTYVVEVLGLMTAVLPQGIATASPAGQWQVLQYGTSASIPVSKGQVAQATVTMVSAPAVLAIVGPLTNPPLTVFWGDPLAASLTLTNYPSDLFGAAATGKFEYVLAGVTGGSGALCTTASAPPTSPVSLNCTAAAPQCPANAACSTFQMGGFVDVSGGAWGFSDTGSRFALGSLYLAGASETFLNPLASLNIVIQ